MPFITAHMKSGNPWRYESPPRNWSILSFPGADRSIRMEDFTERERPSAAVTGTAGLASFLKELDLAEGRSTGVPKILRSHAAKRFP